MGDGPGSDGQRRRAGRGPQRCALLRFRPLDSVGDVSGAVPVRLLGPIDVLVGGEPRQVPGRRLKAVLAALALQPGRVVSVDGLVDIVWGDAVPATGANTLQSHMSHLRRVLDDRAAIRARPPGYLLDVDGEATDIETAERLIGQSKQQPNPADQEPLLAAAVALWRGPPLADLAGLSWFDLHAHRLDQLHLQARHALINARLELGQHQQLIPALEQLIRQHPHYEDSYGQLMLAQYRAGRQADALSTYRRLRHTLDHDLGLSPTQPLRDLESAILKQDPALTPPAVITLRRVPAQLPVAVGGFTGRDRELTILDGVRTGVAVISGTAGIGKTTLAVHWAHRIRCPDGQLYVNLRGFDPARPPLRPAEAVRGFLDALEVPPDRIPSTLDSQIGLYRSLVAGRRMLVVLDNARDADQVRPLLPGSADCLAIVTSRDQLAPLIATEGAVAVYLDLLSSHEARDLLSARIGTSRVTAEPDAVAGLIVRCARLPLALTITAARAQAGRGLPLAALVQELRDAGLDALRAGDAATDLRAVFSWSLHVLDSESGRLFRLLGLHPGPDITVAAAASLSSRPKVQCRAAMAELVRAQLLTEHRPGRYTCHDLLRAYASEQVHSVHSAGVRQAAIHRVVDHYLHSAQAAVRLAYTPPSVPLFPAFEGVGPEEHADAPAAQRWLVTEHAVLLAVAELAAITPGCEEQAWRMAMALSSYLRYANHWHVWAAIQRGALTAALRADDQRGQAYARLGLGRALRWLGKPSAAEITAAWHGFAQLGEPAGHGQADNELGMLASRRGAQREALAHYQHALACFRSAEDRNGQAYALNNIGWCHSQLGEPELTLPSCHEALSLFRTTGDRPGQAAALDSLGYAHQLMADHNQAIGYYTGAIEVYRDFDNHYHEAETQTRLGDTHLEAGDPKAARIAWTRSLHLLTDLGHPDAEQVSNRLHARTQA
jgi:DNA-binding SARP family transcriptional activator